MFEADRRLINNNDADTQLDPIYGTLLTRFYKRSLLERAFDAIPKSLLPSVIAYHLAIIYYEASKLSDRVSILPDAVYHNEPATVLDLWKKNFRYGRSTRAIMSNGYNNDLVRRKTLLRKTRTRKKQETNSYHHCFYHLKHLLISWDYTPNDCKMMSYGY